jgi:very-short-patch-repair endonuclease
MHERDGIMARAEIEDLMPRRTVERRLARGELVRVNRKVLALPGTPLDLRIRTLAAVIALPDAVPTGPSSLVLLGRGPWQEFDLGNRPWLIHRPARLDAQFVTHPRVRVVQVAGLWIAHPKDALIDIVRLWPYPAALELASRAVVQGRISAAELRAANDRLTWMAGRPQLERIVTELETGSRSEAERRLRELVEKAGLTGWVAGLEATAGRRVYHLDLGFGEERLAIEADGRAFHTNPRAFQVDRERQNDLVAAGWTVLRFTWEDIVHHPERVVERIRTVLTQLRSRAA